MGKILTLIISLLPVLYGFSQTENDPTSDCIEKCSRFGLALRDQRVNYFQYPSMDKYDVNYLKLDLNVEADSHEISGSALTKAIALQPMDSFICELRSNMIIDSVFFNGTEITDFTSANDHVFIPLSPAIATGSTITLLIYYHGVSMSGVIAGNNTADGLLYTATVSESFQSREWFPVKQILKDKIDSAEIWISTSATNLAGSNGLLQEIVDLPSGKKQFRWKTRYPMAYYLVSFAVGNYQDYSNYAKPAAMAPDSIPVLHYIVNNGPYFNANKANIDKTPAFIEKFSELYGLYPYYLEKYGHAHASIGGGMENQTMSTVTNFGLILIGHELAHQWFGDNVTCASWNHIWLNEGFASYSEYLLVENLPAAFPTITANTYMQNVHDNVLAAAGGSVFVPEASVFDENRIFNFRLSYKKGSAIIHTLRFEMQNDAQFFQAMQNFQQRFKDSVATAEDFKQVAEEVSGKDFTDFFTQWYYGEGYPTFNVDYSRQGNDLVLLVNQTASVPGVTPFFKGLYEFTINTLQGDTTVKVYMNTNDQVFRFPSNRTPTGVIVDPNNWVLNKVGSITTGLDDPVNVSNEVKLFPNPSPGTAQLQFPSNWFDHFTIHNATGQIIYQQMINSGTTSVVLTTKYPTGVYYIKFAGKNKTALKKFIINY